MILLLPSPIMHCRSAEDNSNTDAAFIEIINRQRFFICHTTDDKYYYILNPKITEIILINRTHSFYNSVHYLGMACGLAAKGYADSRSLPLTT